ncbi:MAG: serine hydrolase domain-containing protein [Rhodococcus sp. (in: high G+C Gram-positive bacteria)]
MSWSGAVAPASAQTNEREVESRQIAGGDASPSTRDLEAFADGAIASSMQDLDPTAAFLSVVRGDDEIVKAYGVANVAKGQRADTSTLFRVGSISKTFTWLSVMILVDEGKLDTNADVNRYLDSFQIPDAFDKPLTMNDLMAQRSGFEESDPWFFSTHPDEGLAEILARTIPERVAAPGERTAYTNWGSALAALVVQEVADEPYDRFVQRRILDPLGMTSTTLRDPVSVMPRPYNRPDLDARMATPYRLKGGLPEAQRYLGFEPAHPMGSAALDARDAATYMRALLNGTQYSGGRLVSARTWNAYQTRLFTDRVGADDFVGGFLHEELAGHAAFGHQGGSQFSASMKLIPELDMGVFIAVNSRTGLGDGRALARLLVLRAEGRTFDALSLPVPIDADSAKELVGTYSPNRRTFSKGERFANLGTDTVISANEDGSVVMARGNDKTRYVPVGKDIWLDTRGERIKAYRDESGKVFRMSGWSIETVDRMGVLESSASFYWTFGLAVLLSITTLLGAWFRWGRSVATHPLGQKLRWLPVTVAGIWLALALSVVWLTLVVAGVNVTDFQAGELNWPPPAAQVVLSLSVLAAVACGLQLLALVPVWLASGWSLWRRIHLSVYTAVLVLAVWAMWNWNMIGKPLTEGG